MKSWIETIAAVALSIAASSWTRADLVVEPPISPAPAAVDVFPAASSHPLSASDLADSAGAYYANTVQVRSMVRQVYGPHAFVLSDQPLLAAPEVLVLVPQPLTAATEGYTVIVLGAARPFQPTQLERQYDWFRASLFGGKGVFKDWQNSSTPVVVAESIRTERGVDLVARPSVVRLGLGRPAGAFIGTGAGSAPPAPLDDLSLLFRADNSVQFANRPVILKALTVWRILAPDIITIGTDVDHQILVRLPEPSPQLGVGDSVNLLGSIKAFKGGWDVTRTGPERGAVQQPVFIQADEVEKR